MQVDDGLAPLGRQQEPDIILVVHKQIISENCKVKHVLRHIEKASSLNNANFRDGIELGEGSVLKKRHF